MDSFNATGNKISLPVKQALDDPKLKKLTPAQVRRRFSNQALDALFLWLFTCL
jgi:hypothetical protein